MPKPNVEIDFFKMEKVNMASSFRPSTGRAVASPRGIQRFASRANPQLVRTAMVAGSASQARTAGASSPTSSPQASPIVVAPRQSPLYVKTGATCSASPAAETTQLTIFYNGAVNTFDGVPRDTAEAILSVAEAAAAVDGRSAGMSESSLPDGNEQDGDDLPIARKKSLLRFLDKRKERLLSASPYHRVERHLPR